MPTIQTRTQDNPKKSENVTGFLGGLNTFQDETVIKDSELTVAKNIILTVDGIEPRPGTTYFNSSQDSRIRGLNAYYKSTGARELIRFSGGKIYKNSGGTWSQIGSTTWTTDSDMNMIQVRDNLYLFNGVESLRYYDGTNIQVFTTLNFPTNVRVQPRGTTGATSYSYRISAFNGIGETLATTPQQITNGNADLDVTNYNQISWDEVTGATGYNVYGRKSTGIGETYLATVYPTSKYQETIVDADINTGTDVITVDRDTPNNTPLIFKGGGTMPGNITAGTTYYALRQSATTIKISTTVGGGAVDITTVGSGARTLEWQTVYEYNDTATTASGEYLDPSTVILPPEANSTVGIVCKKGIFSQSRIFAAGDPNNPSRLYYGGVGSNINNFSFSDTGGGATDIFKNDGAIIRDILPFQGGVIIWKDNAIYKFYFNTLGQPTLEEITRSFGGISFRGSRHVENDVIFPAKKDGRLAFYSLGNQENYASSILRTNELSIKIADNLQDVNLSRFDKTASFYFNNIYGVSITTSTGTYNNRIWCLDTRFGSWVEWNGLNCNVFSDFQDSTGSQYMYYGDDNTGYVNRMFEDTRSDNGVSINVRFATKSFNQKQFNKIKRYFGTVLQFKDINISNAINGDIILDGATVSGTFTVNQATTGGAGFGAILPGITLFGVAPAGTAPSIVPADTIIELEYKQTARSLKYEFRSNTVNAKFKFLSLAHIFKILEGKRLPSTVRFYV